MLASADVGFVWNGLGGFEGDHPAMLWEADPARLAGRYPDSRVMESYGDEWPPPCVDYWIYVDPSTMTVELSVEGWDLSRETLGLTGDGTHDGQVLATRFAEILGVAPPRGRDA